MLWQGGKPRVHAVLRRRSMRQMHARVQAHPEELLTLQATHEEGEMGGRLRTHGTPPLQRECPCGCLKQRGGEANPWQDQQVGERKHGEVEARLCT